MCNSFYRDRKNHDSQRRDKTLRLCLRPQIRHFSPDFETVLLLSYTETLEKEEKHQLKKFQKTRGENSLKLQISVACHGRTCPDSRPLH